MARPALARFLVDKAREGRRAAHLAALDEINRLEEEEVDGGWRYWDHIADL